MIQNLETFNFQRSLLSDSTKNTMGRHVDGFHSRLSEFDWFDPIWAEVGRLLKI